MTKYITTPVLAAGTAAVKFASDYNENLNKVDASFKDSAGVVKEWAKTATEQFGLSESAALEATSLFGDMGTSMGLTTEQAAEMAISLTGLAGDLSSFKNIGISEAMTALKGVFTGETESLKELGVVMTETNLKEFADGLGLVYDEMSQTEKVTLRYQYVLDKTKNAQGDYIQNVRRGGKLSADHESRSGKSWCGFWRRTVANYYASDSGCNGVDPEIWRTG